jgi:hypothetical protein
MNTLLHSAVNSLLDQYLGEPNNCKLEILACRFLLRLFAHVVERKLEGADVVDRTDGSLYRRHYCALTSTSL